MFDLEYFQSGISAKGSKYYLRNNPPICSLIVDVNYLKFMSIFPVFGENERGCFETWHRLGEIVFYFLAAVGRLISQTCHAAVRPFSLNLHL